MEAVPFSKAGDPRLGALLNENVTSTTNVKVAIIGYPTDEGVARNQGRVGSKFGPQSFRKYLPKIGSLHNPEFNVSLYDITVKDLGDVQIAATLEDTHTNLRWKVRKALDDGFITVLIGGGHDQSYPNASSLMDHLDSGNIGVVNIDAHLDVRPLLDGNLAHSGSAFRQILEDPKFRGTFVEFGMQGAVCGAEHAKFVESKEGRIYWLSQIRNADKNVPSQFADVLNNLGSEQIFIGFDIHAVKSSDCPGVSAPRPEGFTAEEAMAICREAGKNKNVRLLELSELNPQVEEDRTSRLVVQMFYNFLLGVAERSSNK